jgi:hypothetical protein
MTEPNGTAEAPYQNVGSCDGVCPRSGARCSPCPQLLTEDNRTPIAEGMRLYNYYDGEWGTVAEMPTEYSNGWFTFVTDDGYRSSLNGVRVATTNPIQTHDPRG